MSRHTITHADEIFIGDAVALGSNSARRGIEMMPVHQQVIEDSVAPDPNGIAEAQAVAAAGDLTLDGTIVDADGVAILDFARNVSLVSDNAGDTTQTATVTGTDIHGAAQVEDIALNGVTEVFGAKAFKTVSQVAISAATAGNMIAGTPVAADTEFGLDSGLESLFDVVMASDGLSPLALEGGVFTVQDATVPATATTGDTKGTYNPSNAPDGSADYVLWFHPILTKESYRDNFAG